MIKINLKKYIFNLVLYIMLKLRILCYESINIKPIH